MIHAACIACREPLDIRERDDHHEATRTCDCPWPPRAGTYARLAKKRDDSNAGRLELVLAWTTP